MGTKGSITALALVAGLAFTATGCGGDDAATNASDSPATPAASETTAKTAAPKGSTVKIGMITGVDAPIYSTPANVAASKAAIAGINARGGLAGHKVEFVFCNDKNDPNLTSKCARQMVKENVLFVGGDMLFGHTAQPVLEKAGIPELGINALSPQELNGKNVYMMSCSGLCSGQVLVSYATGCKVPTGVWNADNPTAAAFLPALRTAAAAAGQELTNIVPISATQADFSSVVQKGQANGTKAMFINLDKQSIMKMIQSATQSGATFTHYLSPHPIRADEAESVGGDEALSKTYYATSYPLIDSSNPMIRRFVEEMKAQEDTGDEDAALSKMISSTFNPWLAVQVAELLVKQNEIEDPTAANLTKALDEARDLDLGGVIPPWTPTKQGPKGFTRISNPNKYIVGFKDGKDELLTESIGYQDAANLNECGQ